MCNVADWIKIPNQLKDSWIWQDNEKRGAWIDLLFRANHEKYNIMFKGDLIDVQSGEVVTSIRQLSDDWKWGKTKVYVFLKMLEDDNLICKVSDNKCTLIKICDYSIYSLTSGIAQDKVENIDNTKENKENTVIKEEKIKIENTSQQKLKLSNRTKRYYDNEELNQAFIDFVEMRKKIKKPLTPRALTMAQNKLAKYAKNQITEEFDEELAVKILEQSIFKSWTDIYPLKDDENSNTNNRVLQNKVDWSKI